MYEKGQLIAVDGVIYEYDGIEADGLHRVYVIDIDEEGILTHTYNSWYLTDEELTTGFNKINLTQKQWCGVVSLLLREKLKYSEEMRQLLDNILIPDASGVRGNITLPEEILPVP